MRISLPKRDGEEPFLELWRDGELKWKTPVQSWAQCPALSKWELSFGCCDDEARNGGRVAGEQTHLSKATIRRKLVSEEALSQTKGSQGTARDAAAWGSRKELRQLYSMQQK